MRPMPMPVLGLLLLCLPAFLASCATDGPKPAAPTFYEVPVERTVPLPERLTEIPPLEPLPSPAFRQPGPCAEGCYTNDQVQAALDAALDWGLRLADRLWAIRLYSDEAVRSEARKKER